MGCRAAQYYRLLALRRAALRFNSSRHCGIFKTGDGSTHLCFQTPVTPNPAVFDRAIVCSRENGAQAQLMLKSTPSSAIFLGRRCARPRSNILDIGKAFGTQRVVGDVLRRIPRTRIFSPGAPSRQRSPGPLSIAVSQIETTMLPSG